MTGDALSWALTVLMAAVAGVFLVLCPGRPLQNDIFGGVAGAAFLVLALAYGTVGVGWVLTWLALVPAVMAVRVRLRRARGASASRSNGFLAVTTAVGVVVVLVMGTWFQSPARAPAGRGRPPVA